MTIFNFQPPLEETLEDLPNRKSPPESDKKEKSEVVLNMPMPEVHSIGGVLVHMPHVCSVCPPLSTFANLHFWFSVTPKLNMLSDNDSYGRNCF